MPRSLCSSCNLDSTGHKAETKAADGRLLCATCHAREGRESRESKGQANLRSFFGEHPTLINLQVN